jgi:hypothetical protein
MRRGLYRTLGVDGRPDDIRVDDEGIELPMEEGQYRARGHLPLVDDLPWQEDYFNTKAPAASKPVGSDAARAGREQARQEIRARFDKR